MGDAALGGGEDELLAAGDGRGEAGALAADAGEVGGEAVEVVLAPDLEGVVVALGAFEPDAEEELAHHGGGFLGLSAVPEHDGGAVGERAAAGGDDGAGELVVGHVAAEGGPEPPIEVVNRLDADPVRVRAQEVGPLAGPEVGVFGLVQEVGDQPVALLGRGVVEVRADLVRGRQAADGVEVGAAEEGGVVRRFGGGEAEGLELGPDVLVNEVAAGERGVEVGGDLAGKRDGDVAGGEVPLKTGGDGGLAGDGAGADQAVLIDGHQGALAGLEGGEGGDVSGGAVGVLGLNDQLLLFFGQEPAVGGLDGDAGERGGVLGVSGHSGGDPGAQGLVVRVAGGEAGAASVGEAGGGLGQQQAAVGVARPGPAAEGVPGDGPVVGVGVEAQQGELEPVLARRLAVAGAGVAAETREDGLNVALEGGLRRRSRRRRGLPARWSSRRARRRCARFPHCERSGVHDRPPRQGPEAPSGM